MIDGTRLEDYHAVVAAFVVDGVPVPQGSLRAYMAGGRPVITYGNREPLALWRDAIRDACPFLEPELGPFVVRLVFNVRRPRGHYGAHGILPRYANAHPTSRPDIDKLARAAIDALTMRVWRDDGQVTSLMAHKRYAETAGLEAWIWRA